VTQTDAVLNTFAAALDTQSSTTFNTERLLLSKKENLFVALTNIAKKTQETSRCMEWISDQKEIYRQVSGNEITLCLH
jgi:hypothetical protein